VGVIAGSPDVVLSTEALTTALAAPPPQPGNTTPSSNAAKNNTQGRTPSELIMVSLSKDRAAIGHRNQAAAGGGLGE
jgi:hypothetical protein